VAHVGLQTMVAEPLASGVQTQSESVAQTPLVALVEHAILHVDENWFQWHVELAASQAAEVPMALQAGPQTPSALFHMHRLSETHCSMVP
jgi:hypothetical protein